MIRLLSKAALVSVIGVVSLGLGAFAETRDCGRPQEATTRDRAVSDTRPSIEMSNDDVGLRHLRKARVIAVENDFAAKFFDRNRLPGAFAQNLQAIGVTALDEEAWAKEVREHGTCPTIQLAVDIYNDGDHSKPIVFTIDIRVIEFITVPRVGESRFGAYVWQSSTTGSATGKANDILREIGRVMNEQIALFGRAWAKENG